MSRQQEAMRILFVVHTFPPDSWGGTELHVRDVANVLGGDHVVRIFCREGNASLPDGHVRHGIEDGLAVTRFNNLFSRTASFAGIYLDAAAHAAFELELDEFRPDIVHIHHLTGLSISFVHACRRRRLPVVFSLHDFWTVCPRGQRLTPELRICENIDRNKCFTCLEPLWPQWFSDRPAEPTVRDRFGKLSPQVLAAHDQRMAEVFDLCDVLLTPSEFHAARMRPFVSDPVRVVALAHGLDHTRFAEPKDAGRPCRVVGYIGSVIPPKGVHTLIEAFRLLGERDLELHVWGKAPQFHERRNYFRELQSLALGCESPVRFMGEYENRRVGQILRNIDVLVVPSLWWETFSLTIREAMLAGVPVVASDIGAMREAIEHSRAGLCFRAGDPGDLARILRRVLDDRELRIRLASRRDQVKTIQQNAEDYLSIYDKAKQSAKRRPDAQTKTPEFPEAAKTGEPSSAQLTPSTGKLPPAVGRDVKVSIEKLGDGEVRVASAVEREDGTRVSFLIGYGEGESSGQVRLVVDFPSETTAPAPRKAVRSRPTPTPPPAIVSKPKEEAKSSSSDAPSSIESMVRSQTPEHDMDERERLMYMLDQRVFASHVEKLDDMVKSTHLDEDDQVIRNAPARADGGRRRSGPRGEGRDGDRRPAAGDTEDRGPRRPTRDRDRDETARPPREIRRPSDEDRDDASDTRPPRRQEGRSTSATPAPSDAAPAGRSSRTVAPRPDLRERLAPASSDAPPRSAKPETTERREERSERPARFDGDTPRAPRPPSRLVDPDIDPTAERGGDRGHRSESPSRRPSRESEERPQRPAAKERPPRPAPEARATGEIEWVDDAGGKSWNPPTETAEAPKAEEKQPESNKDSSYYRTGAQPSFQRDDSGSFGDGL